MHKEHTPRSSEIARGRGGGGAGGGAPGPPRRGRKAGYDENPVTDQGPAVAASGKATKKQQRSFASQSYQGDEGETEVSRLVTSCRRAAVLRPACGVGTGGISLSGMPVAAAGSAGCLSGRRRPASSSRSGRCSWDGDTTLLPGLRPLGLRWGQDSIGRDSGGRLLHSTPSRIWSLSPDITAELP